MMHSAMLVLKCFSHDYKGKIHRQYYLVGGVLGWELWGEGGGGGGHTIQTPIQVEDFDMGW